MGIRLYPEYKDYNEVKVTLMNEYVISNINKKSNVGTIDNVQLQSLTITGPKIHNEKHLSATGQITVADYKHTIYNLLTKHFEDYRKKNTDNTNAASLFPGVKIEIHSYTGSRSYYGNVLEWNMSFNGALSTITINWSSIVPEVRNGNTAPNELGKFVGIFETPYDAIKRAKEVYKYSEIDFIYIYNNTRYTESDLQSASLLMFPKPIELDLSAAPSTSNRLIDCYNAIVDNAITVEEHPVYGEVIDNKYIVRPTNMNLSAETTDNSRECSDIIFVLNGKYLPYSQVNGKLVVPLTSFTCNFNFKDQVFRGDINGNFNGTVISDNNGTWLSTESIEGANRVHKQSIDHKFFNEVSFECLNTLCFENYNLDSKVKLEIFDECGNHVHVLSDVYTITEHEYTIDGAVVKASVKCTNLFSSDKTKVGEEQVPPAVEDKKEEDTKEEAKNSDSPKEKLNDLVTYLKSEDDFTVSLSFDSTKPNTKTFYENVDKFIQLYGTKSGNARNLDFGYVKDLHEKRQYGLLSLLMAAANYGVKDYPERWKSDEFIDPVLFYNNGKEINHTKFGASSIGKKPFDYEEGGIGIAHFDSGSLIDIYTTMGFKPEEVNTKEKRDHFNEILTYDHRIIDWQEITISSKAGISDGIIRVVPIFDKRRSNHVKVNSKDTAYYRKFALLKGDTAWKDWARELVNYVHKGSNIVNASKDAECYPFQRMLFDLWVNEYWIPTINGLKKCNVQPGHLVSLQDAVRISRAGNSGKDYINQSCGKNVAEQFVIYRNMQDREIKQKAFCRRCANIISWLVRNMVD
jgi:hypothetical protein